MSERSGQALADPWGVVPQRLRPPVLRPDVLPRTDLVRHLTSATAPVVVLRAGAGYGKTTALAQWVAADPRAVGWVGLDPSDNDPVVLFRHVVRALADSGRDVAVAEGLLARTEPQLARVVLPALAEALDVAEPSFLLVLDDVHVLEDRTVCDLLERLLSAVPPGSTIALAGRSMPPLRLSRRVLDGTATELGREDLAFSDAEAAELLALALPDLPGPVADQLVRRTEHWPAGLHLGVLALRDHPDPPQVVEGLLSGDRLAAEYLQEEVLDRVGPPLQDFLLGAACLDRLSGDLCDEALERRDSRQVLQELSDSGNLFVVAVDTDPDAFRIHHLFAELLVAELRRRDPAREVRIRARAAAWHDRHGESDPAVRQALDTGDLDLASRMLFRQIAPAFVRGEGASLQRWIDSFPASRIHQDGLLALAAAWSATIHGRRTELERYLAAARAAEVNGPLPDGTASFEVALAALEVVVGVDGVKGIAANADLVRGAGRTGSPWWTLATSVGATCRSLTSNDDPAEPLRAAEVETRGAPAMHAVTLAQLAIAHFRAGDVRDGHRRSGEALAEVRAAGLEHYSMIAIVYCAAAWSAALRNDRVAHDHARERVTGFLEMMNDVVPRFVVQSHLVFTEASLVLRDVDDALRCLEVATGALPMEPDAVVLHEWVDELERRADRLRGYHEVLDLTAAERRVLEQLVTHRSLGEIGEQLFVSRNTVKTHTLSIYRKLAVSGRSDAVERARALGLVDAGSDRSGTFTPKG